MAVKNERLSRGVPDTVQAIEHSGETTNAASDNAVVLRIINDPVARKHALAALNAAYGRRDPVGREQPEADDPGGEA